MSTIPHPLRQWRKSQNPPVTLAKMAADLHVQPPTVSRWENWKQTPSAHDLRRIWEITSIPMHEMVRTEAAE